MEIADLQGDARLAMAEALADYPDFTLPEPLVRCTRCGERASFYQWPEGDGYVCGSCGPRVSIFVTPVPPTDLRQLAADAALEQQENDDA